MSYNRMETPTDLREMQRPINNGERYPPIPLPPPPSLGTETKPGMHINPSIFLDSAPIIINNSAVLVVEGQDESLDTKNLIFNDQTIRKGFIRKVYLILLTQLLFTCGVICIFMYHGPTKLFVRSNPIVVIVAMVVNLVVLISMACCETARRHFPVNFICLGLFTVTMSLMLGGVASFMDANLVLIAVSITALLVAALSIFAIQTKYDFTAMGGVLIAIVISLLILAFAGAFLRQTFGETAFACLGALFGSFMLIYDTQLIIGGTHKYQFNPEDYIFAALTLYIDVVRIFLYILRFMARE
ncbi:PREDICTED: protein lifeguard 1 [Drosophila arizonae]|uniref:Protein lifeguard 1 n=1 Tax=Drosophila arizonae TaxID=7263 RepID=A0ABM1PP09_DROAR|nr:PREDICTED: protein lifeguard 1 [Drosophila arizonae]